VKTRPAETKPPAKPEEGSFERKFERRQKIDLLANGREKGGTNVEKPTRFEDLTFLLNTQDNISGICERHLIQASAQVEAHFKEMPTNVAVLVCCAEGCTGESFSLARDQAADLLEKNQLMVYSHKCGEGVWRTSQDPGAEELPLK
jgi:hypothetical protein